MAARPAPAATASRGLPLSPASADDASCGSLRTSFPGCEPSARAIGCRGFEIELRIRAGPGLDVDHDRGLFPQKERRLAFRQCLHSPQLALDRARPYLRGAQRVADHLELLLRLGENVAERSELGLHGSEQPPYLAGTALDGERPKAHLQTIQDCGQCRRAGKGDLILALYEVAEARTPQNFRIQAFYR